MNEQTPTQMYMDKFLQELQQADIARLNSATRADLAERLAIWVDKIVDAKLNAVIEQMITTR